MKTRRWVVAAMSLAIVFTLGAATMVVAGAGPTTASGATVTRVKTVGSSDHQSTSSTAYVDLDGASRLINVPTGGALILAEFTSGAICLGPVGVGCELRILIDGTPLEPEGGSNDIFYESENNSQILQLSANRSLFVSTPGSYEVQVEFRVNDDDTNVETFVLGNWHLTVWRIVP